MQLLSEHNACLKCELLSLQGHHILADTTSYPHLRLTQWNESEKWTLGGNILLIVHTINENDTRNQFILTIIFSRRVSRSRNTWFIMFTNFLSHQKKRTWINVEGSQEDLSKIIIVCIDHCFKTKEVCFYVFKLNQILSIF